jgi:CBS domain-containing protein
MQVKNLMIKDVVTLKPTQSLEAATRVLARHRIKGAPVLDEHGSLVGIVSRDDILAAVYGGSEEKQESLPDVQLLFASGFAATNTTSLHEMRVGDVMTRSVVTVTADKAVKEACAIMVERRINRLPVVDGKGALIGIVSASDVLKAVAKGDCTEKG